MEDYPATLLEFEQRFATEQACRDYLAQLRWPDGFRCPGCESPHAWLNTRGLWECAQCHRQTSVTSGTIFQDTRLPMRLWFRAMWYLTNQKYGANALGLQRVLGLGSYHTAWTWLHKLRCAMVRPQRDRLHGLVEVDETYIGGEESGKRGRGAAGKTLVFVAAEDPGRAIGRIRLLKIPNASGDSLRTALQATVEPASTIRTDGWAGYQGLASVGYGHTVVRPSAEVGENLLPLVNRVVSLLKRWLLGTYQGAVADSHLNYYLDEFTFRFNRRTSRSRGKLFYRLVQQAVSIAPVCNREFRGSKPGPNGLT